MIVLRYRRGYQISMLPPVSLEVGRYSLAIKGGSCLERKASTLLRDLTKLRARSMDEARPMTTMSDTLNLTTATNSLGDIPDPTVVRNGNAAGRSTMLKPLLVAPIGRKQVDVALDRDSGLCQDGRELLSEDSIGEVAPSHAARE